MLRVYLRKRTAVREKGCVVDHDEVVTHFYLPEDVQEVRLKLRDGWRVVHMQPIGEES